MVPGLHKMVDFDVSHSILCYQFTLHFLGLRFHFCAMPSKRLQPFVRHLCHRHPLQWITQFQISSVWQLLVPPLYPIESIFSRLSYRMEATGWIGQCLHCHAFSYLMRPRLDEPFSSWASFGSGFWQYRRLLHCRRDLMKVFPLILLLQTLSSGLFV